MLVDPVTAEGPEDFAVVTVVVVVAVAVAAVAEIVALVAVAAAAVVVVVVAVAAAVTVVDVGVGEEAAVTALVGDADRFEVAVVMAAVVAGAEATEVRDAVAE